MSQTSVRLSTGVAGLDEILEGGLLSGRSYLVRGGPGSGKTTLGMHFLAEGAANEEETLFISLDEAEGSIREKAASFGIDLEGVSFLDVSPAFDYFAGVEREPFASVITEAVYRRRLSRVFVDPLNQLRYLAGDDFEFRKQVFSLLCFLMERGVTVLFTSDSSTYADEDLQFMADGVLDIGYDGCGRSVSVKKAGASDARGKRHWMRLSSTGLQVFPFVLPKDHVVRIVPDLPTRVTCVDDFFSEWLERRADALWSPPWGAGKASPGQQHPDMEADRGGRSMIVARICEALRATEAKYRRIVDTADEGIWGIGPDSRTNFVTARMAQMLRYAEEEMMGRPITDFLFAEDVPDHLRRMECRRRGVAEHYQRRFMRRDGSGVWTHVSVTPVFDEEGEWQGVFGMVADITEQKESEETLRRLKYEFEFLVHKRIAELEAENAELARMNKLFIGRELKMIELKKRLNELEEQRGQSEPLSGD